MAPHDKLIDNFIECLDEHTNTENDIQIFLEKNTELIPLPFILNHGVHANCIISKFKIHDGLITDFAYLTKSSDFWYLVLVELEDPKKTIFKSTGEQINFHSEFNNAYDQILAWKSYVDDNKQKVVDKLNVLRKPLEYNSVRIKYALVIGRNSQKENQERRTKLFAQKSSDEIRVMTYDSLISSYQNNPFAKEQKLVLSHWREGFQVKSVPNEIDTSIFSFVKSEYLKISNEARKILIDQNYEIDKWYEGEMLTVNSKLTKSTHQEIMKKKFKNKKSSADIESC